MNKRGFTLLELLVGFMVLLLAVVSFAAVTGTARRAVNQAAELNREALILQNEMEQLRVLSPTELKKLDQTDFADGQGKIILSAAAPDLLCLELRLQSGRSLTTLRSGR